METNKFNETVEKFEILKANKTLFPVCEQLKRASAIRDAIVSDESINSVCKTSDELSAKKKQLLDEIGLFLDSTVKDIVSVKIEPNNEGYATIKDFSNTKKELGKLVTNEIEQNIFNETDDDKPQIFSDIPECLTHLRTLEKVKDSCTSSKYKVLIMGEYQSGKTTTLDALCDGRHIGAIGEGIATSAVPVSVSYAEKDSINIKWKTDEQLSIVLNHLAEHFDEFNREEFDIKDENTRNIWLNKLEELRQSKECPNDVRFLSLCSILLQTYESKTLFEKKKISINEISAITRFPVELETRWKKYGVSNFTVDESIFIFIEQVECYCVSETLKNLNCTIIDCPGLFNSAYDTEVTEYIMTEVNAIMYLLPYHKGVGQDVCKSLYRIKDDYKDVHRKLFIVQNVSFIGNDAFVENNQNEIKRLFGENKEVILYDAHLAYLSSINYSHCNGTLPKTDIEYFCRDISEFKTIRRNGKWEKKEIKKVFNTYDEAWHYYFDRYSEFCDSEDSTPDSIREASGLNDILLGLQRFIEENEAYSVVLSEGINKLSSELSLVKSQLNTKYVEPYILGVNRIKELWEKRLNDANTFKAIVETKIKSTFSNFHSPLTNDIYEKLFTENFYNDQMYDPIADMLYEHKLEIAGFMGLTGFNRKDFTDFITPKINDIIEKAIRDRLFKYWLPILLSGQDQTFAKLFTPEMKLLNVELKNEWSALYSDDKSILMENYICIYPDIQDYFKKGEPNNQSIRSFYATHGSIMTQLLIPGAIITEIVAIVVPIVVTMLITAITAVAIGGIVWVPILIGGAIASRLWIGKSKQWIKNKFKESLISDLKKTFRNENLDLKFKETVARVISEILNHCQNNLYLDVKKMNNESEIAISTPQKTIECKCFKSIDAISKINQQLQKYELFRGKHVKYE